ncbi:MAG: hypothetical protein IIB77_05565 [Proteobacteria bacterium]|nr:hypothetical protein [Pseudomonadota bacterium]
MPNWLDITLQILGVVKWPVIALIGIWWFKKEFSDLMGRIRKVNKGGVKFRDKTRQPMIAPDRPTPGDEQYEQMMQYGYSNLLPDAERLIDKDFAEREIVRDEQKIDILRRHLAVTQIYLQFQQIHAFIFGSQVALLRDLNSVVLEGRNQEYIDAWANAVIAREQLEGWTAQQYMAYLLTSNLVLFDEDAQIWKLSLLGQDYLLWILRENKLERAG